MSLLGNKKFVTILLYRGSDHGWYSIDFHSRCDYKGPTICLFKIEGGQCIGGFTKAQWQSLDPSEHVGDSDAMLFNLSTRSHFPSKNTGKDIYCGSQKGPCFNGGGLTELSAEYEPFNGHGACLSFANQPGYNIPVDAYGSNMLTSKFNMSVTISELEVWQVQYLVTLTINSFLQEQ